MSDYTGTPGIVLEVSELSAGTTLSAPTAVGVVSLPVEDLYDFDPRGGTATIGSEQLAYSSVDLDLSALNLTAATTVAYDEGQPVLVFPAASDKWALVKTDDDEDAFRARIPHALSDRFETGIRNEEDRENVSLRVFDDTWTVEDIIGVPAIITGSLIRTAEEGARWELGSSTEWYGDKRSLKSFSGNPLETNPAEIFGRYSGIGIKGTDLNGVPGAEFGVMNREFETGPDLYKGVVYATTGTLNLSTVDGPASDGTRFGAQVRIDANPDSALYQGASWLEMRSNGTDGKAKAGLFSNGKVKLNAYTIPGWSQPASIDLFMGGDPEFGGTPDSRFYMDEDEILQNVGTTTSTRMDLDEITDTVGNGVVSLKTTGMAVGGPNGKPTLAMQWGRTSAAGNASGVATIAHGLGAAPVAVIVKPEGTQAYDVVSGSYTATTFSVTVLARSSGAVAPNITLPVCWVAFR